MHNITKLKIAIDILSTDDAYNKIEFIATIEWSTIPESYKLIRSVILSNHKIEVYAQDDTRVVYIDGVGIFQII